MVESYNQQQIYRSVINYLNLPLVQGHWYTEWDICESCEEIIFIKSSHSDILEIVGVPKSTIWQSLNVIFPLLRYFPLKHLWGLIVVNKTTNKVSREVIEKSVAKNKSGTKTYLLKDKEAYNVAKSEIDGSHKNPRDTIRLANELQQVICDIGKISISNTI